MSLQFQKLPKLKIGDKVAIVSPSFAAPGVWPHVYELGLSRLRDIFGLIPVEFLVTKKVGASSEERMEDLKNVFINPEIKAVIASIGGDDQVTYIKFLEAHKDVFINNPKAFFGYSDNTHFANFLWLNGISSYYGASLFTQFAMQNQMDDYTIKYIKHAMFDIGYRELVASEMYNDKDLDWADPENLKLSREYKINDGYKWDLGENKNEEIEGISWGGCLESIDELLRHDIQIPSLEQFKEVILFFETCEELNSAHYVMRVLRGLGGRGILQNVKAILVGRSKAWEFDKQLNDDEQKKYKKDQEKIIIETVRKYNKNIPIIQNMDFGHTDPQIPLPYGGNLKIDIKNKKVFAEF